MMEEDAYDKMALKRMERRIRVVKRLKDLNLIIPFLISMMISSFFEAAEKERIQEFHEEIDKLSQQLAILKRDEQGVLDRLWSLESERKLLEAEIRSLQRRIDQMAEDIKMTQERISRLRQQLTSTIDSLCLSIKKLYKLGKLRHYRLILAAENQAETIQIMKYATYFARKDLKLIESFRKKMEKISEIKQHLEQEEKDLGLEKEKLSRKREQLIRSEREWHSMLRSIQNEKEIHYQAKKELIKACQQLEQLVHSLGEDQKEKFFPVLDASKFKRFFSWPARGQVSMPFGKRRHPRFGTEIPHNGIDISAAFGSDIRSTFDGKVVFAEWFKGYGLTVIIDHGHDIYSIYAHASAILVEVGEWVKKGALIGKVGDSASLKGPYLYFEIREKGKPTDPEQWLSKR